MVFAAMAYSDQFLLPHLKALSSQRKTTTATEIAEVTGVPLSTVKRRLDAMERAGVIRRGERRRRWGFKIMSVEEAE